MTRIAAHSAVARPSSSLGFEWMEISSTLLVGVGSTWRLRSGGRLATRGGQAGGFRMGGVRVRHWCGFSRQGCTPSGIGSIVLQIAEAGVGDVLERAISKQFERWLVVYCYLEVTAPEDEVPGFVEGVGYC